MHQQIVNNNFSNSYQKQFVSSAPKKEITSNAIRISLMSIVTTVANYLQSERDKNYIKIVLSVMDISVICISLHARKVEFI